MLHSAEDIARAKAKVAAGAEPWLSGWKRLEANKHSAPTWKPRPQATVVRGGPGENYDLLYEDIAAAYQNALRWHIGGTKANAEAAVRILNAWSRTLNQITGDNDHFLAAGIYGWQFANAAELMREYPGFDLAACRDMLTTVFYPINNDFLTNHNGSCITNYWANWDLCNTASVMAIGILTGDDAKYRQALRYFRAGPGNGSLPHAVPFLHSDIGQWQESGRDQGHTLMGLGQAGAICEMAWNQGEDLYGLDDNRFMKAARYVARYNLGGQVPFTPYSWGDGVHCERRTQTAISPLARGQVRPVWDMLYYHYAGRRRMPVPDIAAIAARGRAEGGGGDYGSDSGGFDQLGFGTLMYAR